MDDLLQTVLVLSCDPKHSSTDLIKKIVGNDTELEQFSRTFDRNHVTCYPWHLSTKYYDADIHFVELKDQNLVSKEFAESVEALVIYFDNDSVDSFNKVKSWLPFIKEYDPEIRIIACDSAAEKSVYPKVVIQQWCVENRFELVEINPESVVDEDDLEDDFQESNSIKRVLQALHAHAWPEMSMKTSPSYTPSSKFQDTLGAQNLEEELERLGLTSSVKKDEAVNQTSSAPQTELADGSSFESLFSQFKEMKDRASNLSERERREYAEKTAIAFWQAMGGDEDEISGLDDDA